MLGVERLPPKGCGWSTCKHCNTKFPGNELRIFWAEVDDKGMQKTSKYWHHLPCLSRVKTAPWRAKAAAVSPDQILGYSDLDPIEQNSIQSLLKSMRGAEANNIPKSKSLLPWMTNKGEVTSVEDDPANGDRAEQDNEADDVCISSPEDKLDKDATQELCVSKKAAVAIDRSLLNEAKSLGFESKLAALAANQEIVKRGLSASSLLEALKSASGSVVQAKHKILSPEVAPAQADRAPAQVDRAPAQVDRAPAQVGKAKKEVAPAQVDRAGEAIDGHLRQEARRLGFEKKLEMLAANPKILERGHSASSLLEALRSAEGSVVQAKHALLNAR
jgi:hypothetical protein